MNTNPISYIECKHTNTRFIQSGDRISTDGEHGRHRVTLCADCGLFSVYGDQNGVHFTVTFTLPTGELVEAAGQYVKHLAEAERAQLTARSVWPGEG